ncbi:MAG: aminotransferase class IV [Firmicutes bacterium]|jgi:D-alanine transaminase|nr:aminotransferase class IV [Bacillota bacterium]
MAGVVFLNGDIVGIDEAKVSILDRANVFADGLYEVVRCYGGRLFELETHMKRLLAGASALAISHDFTLEWLIRGAERLARESGVLEGEMYIQLSRGPAVRTHYFPSSQSPVVFITLGPVRPIPAEARTSGTSVVTCPDIRWGWCHLKTVNLLANCLAKEKAHRLGMWEGIMVRGLGERPPLDADSFCAQPGVLAFARRGDQVPGNISEGASANVFVVDRGEIVTPPKENILPGVTRALAIDLARGLGLRVTESPIATGDLLTADEMFLTSTIGEIMPVVQVDGQAIGDGRPGRITQRLADAYRGLYHGMLGL